MTTTITTIIAKYPPRQQAALAAYRASLNRRRDWHMAVCDALEAADAAVDKEGVLVDSGPFVAGGLEFEAGLYRIVRV